MSGSGANSSNNQSVPFEKMTKEQQEAYLNEEAMRVEEQRLKRVRQLDQGKLAGGRSTNVLTNQSKPPPEKPDSEMLIPKEEPRKPMQHSQPVKMDEPMVAKPKETLSQPSSTMSAASGAAMDSRKKERMVHSLVSDAFLVTADHKEQQSSKGLTKTYLYEFSAQNNDGREVLWSADDMDIILCTRLSKMRSDNKFQYLYQSFERIGQHLLNKTKGFETAVKELKNITCRYFVTLLSFPETFDINNEVITVQEKEKIKNLGFFDGSAMAQSQMQNMAMYQWIMPKINRMTGMIYMRDPEDLQSNKNYITSTLQNELWDCLEHTQFLIDREFMAALSIELAEQDKAIKDQFYTTIFDKMHLAMADIRYSNFMAAETNLERIKILLDDEQAAQIFVESADFLPRVVNPSDIQRSTYLGRYLSFTALTTESESVKNAHFNVTLHKMRPEGHTKIVDQVSVKFHKMHGQIADVIKKLMKNPKSKQRTLQWLRQAMDLNYDKKKYHTDKEVVSNGFVLNYMDVMLQLCKPFIGSFEKYGNFFSKVNCFYLFEKNYLDSASKYDKLVSNSDGQEAQVIFAKYPEQANLELSGVTTNPHSGNASSLTGDGESKMVEPNFISECFFLAHLAAYFIGSKLQKEYESLNKSLNKAWHEKDFESFEKILSRQLCLNVHILGKPTAQLLKQLFSFTSCLLMTMANKKPLKADSFKSFFSFMEKEISYQKWGFNATEPLPVDLQVFPQFVVENLYDIPPIIKMIQPDSYYGLDLELQMQTAFSCWLLMERRIQNAHFRAHAINFIMYIVPQKNPGKGREKENMMYKDVFFQSPVLRAHLMQAMVFALGDSEQIDYYSKFPFRHAATVILEYIFGDRHYREKFMEMGSKLREDFENFCNVLVLDLNSLYLEGIISLGEIKQYEEEKDDHDLQATRDQDYRDQIEAKYNDNMRKAKFNFQLTTSVLQLLARVTLYCRDPFLSDQLGFKFAQAINFCIDQLSTEKGLKIKIANPERFEFDPKGMLANLINMYVNMAPEQRFKEFVVKDDRSYSDETFDKAIKIIQRGTIMVGQEELDKFKVLAAELKELNAAKQSEEMNFDDAPDEFLDPLTCNLMEDPVELPSSKTLIDRSSIQQHLLNDPHDPFNRAPLTIDEIIERPDFRQRIEDYKEEKRALAMSKQ